MYKDIANLLSTAYPYIQWPFYRKDLVLLIEGWSHEVKPVTVVWPKPPEDIVKLNTDESALDNLGSSGVGGIYRNNCSDLIFAFSSPIGMETNN